jgi:hypothetical protein
MDTTTALWTGAALAAFGALIAFALGRLDAAMKERDERRGHLRALRAEIDRAGDLADGYLKGGVLVPTTRLPQGAYIASFPALVRAGELKDAEIEALFRFFDNADGFNRSLEYAQATAGTGLTEQVGRARVKAKKIAKGQPQQVEALAIVTRYLEARLKRRLLFWR